jgi:hypothetical protein
LETATNLFEYPSQPPNSLSYSERPAPIYIIVTKIVPRTCPREGIMLSLYHEETKKRGRSKATSACCKYIAQCHDRQSREDMCDEEEKEKERCLYRKKFETKEKRGSVVVVSDLST